jgi:hypothetical protein
VSGFAARRVESAAKAGHVVKKRLTGVGVWAAANPRHEPAAMAMRPASACQSMLT